MIIRAKNDKEMKMLTSLMSRLRFLEAGIVLSAHLMLQKAGASELCSRICSPSGEGCSSSHACGCIDQYFENFVFILTCNMKWSSLGENGMSSRSILDTAIVQSVTN
jgi:hypothetical protein